MEREFCEVDNRPCCAIIAHAKFLLTDFAMRSKCRRLFRLNGPFETGRELNRSPQLVDADQKSGSGKFRHIGNQKRTCRHGSVHS